MSLELSPNATLVLLIALALLTLLSIFCMIKALIHKRKWWMQLSGAAGLIATAILVILALQTSKKPSNRIETTDSRLFKSRDNLTAVAGPLSWTETPLGPEDASLKIGNVLKGEFLAIISEPKSEFSKGYTIQDYATSATESLTDYLINTTQFELVDFTLNGMPACSNRVHGYLDQTKVDYFNTFVEGKNHFHQIRCWTPSEKRIESSPVLRKVTSSFHEIPY